MHRDSDTVDVAGDLHLIYTRLVTRRQGFEFSSHCERATHLALPMCGFERVAALILEPVSKGASVFRTSSYDMLATQQLVAGLYKAFSGLTCTRFRPAMHTAQKEGTME